MNIVKKLFLAAFLLVIGASFANAQYKTIDRIAAIVDDEIILYSELLEQVELYLLANRVQNISEPELKQLQKEMLDGMIDDKVIVKMARKEEGIRVNAEEVEQALESSIADIKSNYPTDEAFQEELKAQGLTIEQLKEEYRQNIEDQIYKSKYINQELRQKIQITNEELNQFYEEHKDEIPTELGDQVSVAHILFALEPTEESYKLAAEQIATVKSKLDAGENFEELAKEYSDDPGSSQEGGDLGFFKLNEMVPEFSDALKELEPGGISDIIESRFGFHIIKFVEKKDDQYHAKHILAMVKVTDNEIQSTKALAQDVRDSILAGTSFEDMVKKHSDDIESIETGGALGVFELDKMESPYKEAIQVLEQGEISEVVQSNYGFHILKLVEREGAKQITFEDVKPQIREAVYQKKMGEKYGSWIQELRKKMYIETKLEEIQKEEKLINEKRGF